MWCGAEVGFLHGSKRKGVDRTEPNYMVSLTYLYCERLTPVRFRYPL